MHGRFEVRAHKGHILSARLMGTYSSGLSPWTITGNGRSQDDMGRYEYTFQQKYRVDQSMGK
ncbi:MAG: hypothetical protein IPM54_33180 [Polyangiaceae bacterium]|nr:hypothetical protein [Polyangiaceae bacterium]